MNRFTFKASRVVLVLMFCSALEAANVLEDVEIVNEDVTSYLVFQFSNNLPKYNLVTERQGDISILIYEFKETTSEFVPSNEVIRPVLHIEILPDESEGYVSTKVIVYLEKKIPVNHEETEDQLLTHIDWIRTDSKEEPKTLVAIEFESEDENTLIVESLFDEVPSEKFVFLLDDKQKICAVFHNSEEQPDAIQPLESQLIKKIQTKRGSTIKRQPYTKLIFHSDKELLVDLAEDLESFRMEIFAVSGEEIDAIPEPEPVVDAAAVAPEPAPEPETYQFENQQEPKVSEDSNMKTWIYLSLGTGIVVGGAFGAYLYFLDDPEPERPTIEAPGADFAFPDPPAP